MQLNIIRNTIDQGGCMSESNSFEDSDVSDEDYGFIIGPDGALKAMFLPVEVTALPQSVIDILEMFEVELNPDNIPTPTSTNHTLH